VYSYCLRWFITDPFCNWSDQKAHSYSLQRCGDWWTYRSPTDLLFPMMFMAMLLLF